MGDPIFCTNLFLACALILGFVFVLPCCLYLDKLVKENNEKGSGIQ